MFSKLNWGSKVALLYISFVALIIILVTASMKQDFQLVSPDYYQKELKHQQVLDAGKNQSKLSKAVQCQLHDQYLLLEFPDEFKNKAVKGTLQFYAAANNKFDKNVPLNLSENKMIIDLTDFGKTTYTLKINWESENQNYYQETELNTAKK